MEEKQNCFLPDRGDQEEQSTCDSSSGWDNSGNKTQT